MEAVDNKGTMRGKCASRTSGTYRGTALECGKLKMLKSTDNPDFPIAYHNPNSDSEREINVSCFGQPAERY